MSIKITRVAEGLYSAELRLPDMPAVKAEWSTPEPLTADRLIEELVKRGAHQTDIGDAFQMADPNWRQRSR